MWCRRRRACRRGGVVLRGRTRVGSCGGLVEGGGRRRNVGDGWCLVVSVRRRRPRVPACGRVCGRCGENDSGWSHFVCGEIEEGVEVDEDEGLAEVAASPCQRTAQGSP